MRQVALAKFAADALVVVVGLITSLITARVLGVDGRGVFATVSFISGAAGALAVLGLPEALVIAIGRSRATLREALATSLMVVTIATGLFTIVCAGLSFMLVRDEPQAVTIALLAACGVPLAAVATTLGYGHLAEHRYSLSTAASATSSLVTTLMMCVALIMFDWGIVGALVAVVAGSLVNLLVIGTAAYGRNFLTFRGADRGLAKYLLTTGLPLLASGAVITLTARLDLVFVYLLGTHADAGRYSIALALGAMIGMAGHAIVWSAFPRLAYASDDDWSDLASRIAQSTAAASVAAGVLVAAFAPFLIPTLYGDEFSGAVIPAMILATSGGIAATQWSIGRIASARGHSVVPLYSYAVSLGSMCVLDVALIPLAGIGGAAVASTLSALAGLVVASRLLSERTETQIALWPRPASFAELARDVRRLIRR